MKEDYALRMMRHWYQLRLLKWALAGIEAKRLIKASELHRHTR